MTSPAATGTASDPLFELRGVSRTRGGRATLAGVDLAIPAREITALVGPSGAGKTSLLRLLNRLDDPDRGQVRFAGRSIDAYHVRALRRRVGFVFQTPVMFPGTVEENLRLALTVADRADLGAVELVGDGFATKVADRLALAGLDADYAARDAERLSGGERQRVGLARALMTEPEVLLLDEPTAALDPEVAGRLLATVASLSRERGIAVVMVTHRLVEAREVSTFLAMLDAGRVVEAGPTATLFRDASRERTRDYLDSGR